MIKDNALAVTFVAHWATHHLNVSSGATSSTGDGTPPTPVVTVEEDAPTTIDYWGDKAATPRAAHIT